MLSSRPFYSTYLSLTTAGPFLETKYQAHFLMMMMIIIIIIIIIIIVFLAFPVLLYGSETWSIIAKDGRRITAA
jgi:competence protein ComGC